MATLVLGAAGTAIGGAIGGSVLGMSAATIGGFIGSSIGSMVDSYLIASMQPDQRFEGQRLETTRVTSSTEGMPIPWVAGRMRLGGNVIWATDFREERRTETQKTGGGKGGGGSKVTTVEYLYFASFAVAICEGPVQGIGRVWADGDLLDTAGLTWRWYPGDEAQEPDPFIEGKMGAGATPAYRGTCYAVFEDLPLADFGNRLPQLTFEVFRTLEEPGTIEADLRAVCLLPSSGEFIYSTSVVRSGSGGETKPENAHATSGKSDFVEGLDRLLATAPNLESVSLVVSWFGDDLRVGECALRPGVELSAKSTSPLTWSVNGVARSGAHLVSTDEEGRPVYGGTPSDASIVEAIQAIKARGLRVTFYPFILMDVPPGNALPNPYSDNASQAGQPVFPWRGRITCSPAAGFAGSVDKTATAASQVAAFFGSAAPGDFAVSGTSVSFTGPTGEWSLRRMILHYAHLCAAAGGVDTFLIGTEMRGLTSIRSTATDFPAVDRFRALAADARSILGHGVQLSYAADWSEYFGHQPPDGTGDVFFHLDPLWADDEIDFIGIDNYMPLSDWRDGFEHADATGGAVSIYDQAYLRGNIEGGEGYDWYYASEADREAQARSPITDGAGKPWVYRYKDVRSWWLNSHYDRPGGIESTTPTAWVPQSKPIRFTEFGCPAIDRGANKPNVFYDPKSSESFVPPFSRGWRDDTIQRAYLEATIGYWTDPANNPTSPLYGGPMIDMDEAAAWAYDVRPYPFFPAMADVWSDGANWRLGHWLNGRLGSASLPAVVRALCRRAGLPDERIDTSQLWGQIEGNVVAALESPRASIAPLMRYFGFDGIEADGVIRFKSRGRAPSASVTADDLVAGGSRTQEDIELSRGQETELPHALKWTTQRADEEYDAAMVEARRITVQAARIVGETFPFSASLEEGERQCRRALLEAWTGREEAVFSLPPSRLSLDAGDVIALEHDGRALEYRATGIADAAARRVNAARQDREAYDAPPGAPRVAAVARAPIFGPGIYEFLELPALAAEGDTPHQPILAAWAKPWPSELAIYRSLTDNGWALLTTTARRAIIGELKTDLAAGPVARFDLAAAPEIELKDGTLGNVTDLDLFQGANAFAVESAPGEWEVFQAADAELVAPGRYRLTRLLRGQRGTEAAMGDPTPAGARVVKLDGNLVRLPTSEGDIGVPWNWRIGAASKDPTGDEFATVAHTPSGAGLRPFSVAHVRQPWRRGRVPGDLTIEWVRRSRDLAADSWELAEAPLGEAWEAYEVDIMAGATVLRTLASSTPSVVYAEADQIADFGAALGPGDTLVIRVAQISALVGRGAVETVTLQF